MRVVSSPHNRGKGAALLDGFRLALGDSRVEVAVTLDGDRQHRPEDIPRLVEAARAGADLVTGARGGLDRAPLRSRFGNALTAALVRRLYPEAPPDTQCGFRAHTRRLLAEVVRQIPGERYQTELRILLLALGEGWRVTAVPIPTVYLDGNRASHFAPVADSLRIYRVLLPRFLRRRQAPPRAAVADTNPLAPCESEPVVGRRAS